MGRCIVKEARRWKATYFVGVVDYGCSNTLLAREWSWKLARAFWFHHWTDGYVISPGI
jgi:hypothetical protein